MRTAYANWFVGNAEQVTRWGYTLATLILVAKNLVHPLLSGDTTITRQFGSLAGSMDLLATACFLTSAHMYGLAKNNPAILKKAGTVVLVAACALMLGGWRGDVRDGSFWIQVASMLPTAFAGLCLLTDMKNKRTFGAVPELVSRPFHAIAGLMQGDYGQIAFALTSMLAEIGMIASDYRIRQQNTAAERRQIA